MVAAEVTARNECLEALRGGGLVCPPAVKTVLLKDTGGTTWDASMLANEGTLDKDELEARVATWELVLLEILTDNGKGHPLLRLRGRLLGGG